MGINFHESKEDHGRGGGISVGFQTDDYNKFVADLSRIPEQADRMIANIARVASAEVARLAKSYIGTGGPVVNVGGYSINGWPELGTSPYNGENSMAFRTRQKNKNAGQLLLDTGIMRGSINYSLKGSGGNYFGYISVSDYKAGFHEQDGDPDSGYMTAGKVHKWHPARPFLTPATYAVFYDAEFSNKINKFIEDNFDFMDSDKRGRVIDFFYKAPKKTAQPKKRTGKVSDKKRKK